MNVIEAAEAVRVARDNRLAARAFESAKADELSAAKEATALACEAYQRACADLVAAAEAARRPPTTAADFEPITNTGSIGVRLTVTPVSYDCAERIAEMTRDGIHAALATHIRTTEH